MLIFEFFGNLYVKSFDYLCYVQTYQPHIFNTTSNTLWIFFTDMKIVVSFATFLILDTTYVPLYFFQM